MIVVEAAPLFRMLRSTGVTVRGAIDCIIAQVCMHRDARLSSPDADFTRIARHTRLRLYSPRPASTKRRSHGFYLNSACRLHAAACPEPRRPAATARYLLMAHR
jgi:hypothetical protein